MSSEKRNSSEAPRDPDFAGAEAAMHRAARDARRRAEDAVNVVAQGQSRKKPGELCGIGTGRDLRKLSFSQAQGYEEIPGPLRLEELTPEARTRIYNVFYDKLFVFDGWELFLRDERWSSILRDKHRSYDNLPLDEWSPSIKPICLKLRSDIETMPFNKVFDLEIGRAHV